MQDDEINLFDFIIVGAGIAGAKCFYHLSKLGSTLLVDKQTYSDENKHQKIAKVICAHTFPWMNEVPWQNSDIFPRTHWTSQYASRKHEAIVDGEEFGKPLGKIVHLPHLIHWYLQQGRQNGGIIKWDHNIKHIHSFPHYKELETTNHIIYRCKLLIIATGSENFELHQNLGLPIPKTLNSISAIFEGDAQIIEANLPSDYSFRLHPQISTTGMLWTIRANNFFNIGYVSEESFSEMRTKFSRILQNYKPIQPYFTHISPQPSEITSDFFSCRKSTKYPISRFSTDRCVIIGDAAGLFYPLYLEGIVGCAVSSVLVSQLVNQLQSTNLDYTASNLRQYDQQLKQTLLDSYVQAGMAGDHLFIHGGDKPAYTIWDAYIQVIQNLKQVRKNIYTAYIWQDLSHYPVEKDLWCGERIYQQLPLGKKIALSPIFLKTKFISKNNL